MKGKSILIILGILLLLFLMSGGGAKRSNNSNGMSYQYNNDSTYRKNVNDVSSVYGITPKEAEDTVRRMLNGR